MSGHAPGTLSVRVLVIEIGLIGIRLVEADSNSTEIGLFDGKYGSRSDLGRPVNLRKYRSSEDDVGASS